MHVTGNKTVFTKFALMKINLEKKSCKNLSVLNFENGTENKAVFLSPDLTLIDSPSFECIRIKGTA